MTRYGRNRKLNYINHVALVLDASGSMSRHKQTLIQVADQLVKHLAKTSTEMDQETRVTIYGFDDTVECLVFDKDVLRLPSIKDLYWIGGMTALMDATVLSINDLRQTMTKYGDHAFLTFVLTDGAENASSTRHEDMTKLLTNLRDNETLAVLVPNENGVHSAERWGFPPGNVTIWEVSTKQGLEEAASKITRSVDTYMTGRTLGVKSSRNVFSTDLSAVNKGTVNAKKLTPLPRTDYTLVDVKASAPSLVIREFVESLGSAPYQIGKAYYQLTKTEIIQLNKGIAIQNIHSGRIYTGKEARDVLGLPDMDARVKPNANDEYRIYVQSTSVNRKLVPNTKLLLMK